MNTISDTRKALVIWGEYWQRQRELGGWSNRSTVDRCREILQTGVFSSSGSYCNDSNSISVPDHVEFIDECFERLNVSFRDALRAKYKLPGSAVANALRLGMDQRTYEYYLTRAELEIMKTM